MNVGQSYLLTSRSSNVVAGSENGTFSGLEPSFITIL